MEPLIPTNTYKDWLVSVLQQFRAKMLSISGFTSLTSLPPFTGFQKWLVYAVTHLISMTLLKLFQKNSKFLL